MIERQVNDRRQHVRREPKLKPKWKLTRYLTSQPTVFVGLVAQALYFSWYLFEIDYTSKQSVTRNMELSVKQDSLRTEIIAIQINLARLDAKLEARR